MDYDVEVAPNVSRRRLAVINYRRNVRYENAAGEARDKFELAVAARIKRCVDKKYWEYVFRFFS